jgi:predicted membrane-bound spermidine synthase
MLDRLLLPVGGLVRWVFTARTVVQAVALAAVALLRHLLEEEAHLMLAITVAMVSAVWGRKRPDQAEAGAALGLPGLTLLQAKAVTAG